MSIEQNKLAVRRFFDALNRHDPVLLAAVTLPDVALTWPETIAWLYTTTKGLHFEIVDLVAESAKVSAKLAVSGYHCAERSGIRPTGKQTTDRVFFFFNLLDEIIADVEAITDVENHLKQIGGAITPAEQAA